jgi:hypothetical protein
MPQTYNRLNKENLKMHRCSAFMNWRRSILDNCFAQKKIHALFFQHYSEGSIVSAAENQEYFEKELSLKRMFHSILYGEKGNRSWGLKCA